MQRAPGMVTEGDGERVEARRGVEESSLGGPESSQSSLPLPPSPAAAPAPPPMSEEDPMTRASRGVVRAGAGGGPSPPRCGRAPRAAEQPGPHVAVHRGRRRQGPARRRLRAAAVELVLRRLLVVPSPRREPQPAGARPRQEIHEIRFGSLDSARGGEGERDLGGSPVRRPSEGGGRACGGVTVSSLEWLQARGWSDLLCRRKPVVNAV
jgi:hypothetical protein